MTCARYLFLSLLLIAFSQPLRAEVVQIEAAQMTILHKESRAIFTGRVHLTRGDHFELFADKLVAHYRGNALDHAVASGHVRMTQKEMRGEAERAVLDQEKQTITLTGHAVLTQQGSVVRGETIVHNLQRETTIVTPTKGGRTHMTIEMEEKQP